jgi:ketol-acid reductoisomerase
MRRVLAEIQDGSFAARWIAENDAGRPEFGRLRAQDRDHQIEQVGAELRAAMPFLNPVTVRAGQAQAAASGPAGKAH